MHVRHEYRKLRGGGKSLKKPHIQTLGVFSLSSQGIVEYCQQYGITRRMLMRSEIP